jgi:glyoxylase-like metal-dependent hydrolase (beta-lactamase superfamily II)
MNLTLDVYTSPAREITTGGTFSPTTSTLVHGPTEMALVDAQYVDSDVRELIARIDASGRRLTTIYVTHAHADHYFGIATLLERYPHAKAVALPAVAREIAEGNDTARKQWREWFDGKAIDNTRLPEPLDDGKFTVDGVELVATEIGQADIAHNTVLHIPAIDAVIAGDIVYNGIHPFLAASTRQDWPHWIASLDKVAQLRPTRVVGGHKRAELPDAAATIDETRQYIVDFIEDFEASANSRELVARMTERYPEHGNPSALVLSAVTAFRRR